MEELNQSQSRLGLLCDWFILPLLLPTPTIWLSLDLLKADSEEDGSVLILLTPIPSCL